MHHFWFTLDAVSFPYLSILTKLEAEQMILTNFNVNQGRQSPWTLSNAPCFRLLRATLDNPVAFLGRKYAKFSKCDAKLPWTCSLGLHLVTAVGGNYSNPKYSAAWEQVCRVLGIGNCMQKKGTPFLMTFFTLPKNIFNYRRYWRV